MTSSIPNSFSSEDLEALLKNAPTENEVDNTHNFSEDYMIQLASEICDEMMERSHGPLIHKIVALTILGRLESWHNNVGVERLKDDDTSGVGWIMDAGKCQSARMLLETVDLGSDDFTCHHVCDENCDHD